MSLIMLDWRTQPAKHEITSKIAAKFLDMDHLGILAVDISDTRSKRATSLEIVEGESMLTRRSCVSSRRLATHETYVAKFVAVGHEVGT